MPEQDKSSRGNQGEAFQLPSLSSLEGGASTNETMSNTVPPPSLAFLGSTDAPGTHSGVDLASYIMNATSGSLQPRGIEVNSSAGLYSSTASTSDANSRPFFGTHTGTYDTINSTMTAGPSNSTGYDDDGTHSRPAVPSKRKSSTSVHNGLGGALTPEDEDESSGTAGGEDGDKKKKRAKTPRACDSCRRKKIRYGSGLALLHSKHPEY